MLGVRAALGRFFLPEETGTEGTNAGAVLGHGFWQERFGGDDGVLGQAVNLNGRPYTIVGVAPKQFHGTYAGLSADLWIPITMVSAIDTVGYHSFASSPGDTILEQRGNRRFFMKGRLDDGVSLTEAAAETETIMARLQQEYPGSNEDRDVTLVPTDDTRIHPAVDGAIGPVAAFLLGVVGLVLLIACANVANMFLARAASRRGEIAIRLAIGAGRLRLIRQLLTESITLSVLGGAAGFVLSIWATQLLLTIQPPVPISVTLNVTPDMTVFGFAFLISLGTGVLFGLVPALQSTRTDLVPELKGSSFSQQKRRRRFDLRAALVVVQVAISVVLLVGATLVIRSLRFAETIDVGFEPDRLAILTFNLEMQGYDETRGRDFYATLLERARALPGVRAASVSERLPFSVNLVQSTIHLGTEVRADGPPLSVDTTRVGAGYFETLGVSLLEGRDFGTQDSKDSPRVAIISSTMADCYWPGQSAVGRRFTRTTGTTYEIVGVAADYKVRTVGEDPRPFIHYAREQSFNPFGSILVQTQANAAPRLASLRREVENLEPDILFMQATTMRSEMSGSLFGVRAGAAFLAGFAAFALFLASVGLYGIISYSVGARTREIGTRMALGASSADVLRLVVREGMAFVGIGVVAGTLAAVALSRVLSFLLYGISPLDPLSFILAAAVLGTVALAADIIPARSASRIDPMKALGSE